mgnify:CR=1 FL=1
MKPICFIAARGGSKGVPNKNLRRILNEPLITHTIRKAIRSRLFSHVVVSTEDAKIRNVSKKAGAETPFWRPKELAVDDSSMSDVLLHGINELTSLDYDFDTIVLLDCTVPFLRVSDIAATIKLLRKEKCDIVCGVYEQHLNPYFNITELNSRGYLRLAKNLKNKPQSRQKAPKVYQLTGLYTFDVKKFLKNKKTFTKKVVPLVIPIESGVMIDTEFEFNVVKCLFKKYYRVN